MSKYCIFKDQKVFLVATAISPSLKLRTWLRTYLAYFSCQLLTQNTRTFLFLLDFQKCRFLHAGFNCISLLTGTISIACFFIQQTTWRMTPNVDPLESWNHFLLNHLELNVLMISGRGEFLKTEVLERQKDKQETKTAWWITKLQSNNLLDQLSTVYLILKALCDEIYQNCNCGICHQTE